MYTYIVHITVLKFGLPETEMYDSKFARRSDANICSSERMTKFFSSFAVTHCRKCSCAYAAASQFDVTVKVYIYVFLIGVTFIFKLCFFLIHNNDNSVQACTTIFY